MSEEMCRCGHGGGLCKLCIPDHDSGSGMDSECQSFRLVEPPAPPLAAEPLLSRIEELVGSGWSAWDLNVAPTEVTAAIRRAVAEEKAVNPILFALEEARAARAAHFAAGGDALPTADEVYGILAEPFGDQLAEEPKPIGDGSFRDLFTGVVAGCLEGSFMDLGARLRNRIMETARGDQYDTAHLVVLCDCARGIAELLETRKLARAEGAIEDPLRGLSVLGRVQNIVAAAIHDCSLRSDLMAALQAEALAQSEPSRPWTYCVDDLPERGEWEVTLICLPGLRGERITKKIKPLRYFIGDDGSRGWIGTGFEVPIAWRPLPADAAVPLQRDIEAAPFAQFFPPAYLDSLAP